MAERVDVCRAKLALGRSGFCMRISARNDMDRTSTGLVSTDEGEVTREGKGYAWNKEFECIAREVVIDGQVHAVGNCLAEQAKKLTDMETSFADSDCVFQKKTK